MSIPIITYHEIGDNASPLFTSGDSFRTHLEALAKAGYRTIDLAQLNDLIVGSEPLPDDCIVLTFDDGYRSFLEQAYPLLKQYGFSATVYLISDYCGKDNQWSGQSASAPKSPLMSFDEVRGVIGDTVKIGCHSRSHCLLTKADSFTLEQELVFSKHLIEQELGQCVDTFAYPYGVTNEHITELARLHYRTAVTTQMGTAGKRTDLLLMPRIDACYLNEALIARLRNSSASLFLATRNMLRLIKRVFIKDYS